LTPIAEWTVAAFNTATGSDNKMHDDEVARSYGFRGGLVPGVDVFAYLTHLPVARWGSAFLSRGAIDARFVHPVYDGDRVTVDAAEGRMALSLNLRDSAGTVCATARASLPVSAPAALPVDEIPVVARPDDRPAASPEVFAIHPVLGTIEVGFHGERALGYLADVREALPIYLDERVAHPGWLLRYANYALADNVRLGPWIHVSSAVQFHGLVHDGDRLSVRSRVDDAFERKGHRFVMLDVRHVVNGERVAMRTVHTAIYAPRRG